MASSSPKLQLSSALASTLSSAATPALVASAVALLTTCTATIYLATRSRKPHATIPGPDEDSGLAGVIFGNLGLMRQYADRKAIHEIWALMNEKYGPIAAMRVFNDNIVFLSDEKEIRRMFFSDDYTRDDKFSRASSGLFPSALFTLPSGHQWATHRKHLQPAFGPTHLKHAVAVTNDILSQICHNMEQLIDAQNGFATVNMHKWASAVAADVIGQVAFSTTFNRTKGLIDPKADSQVYEDCENLVSALANRLALPPALWSTLGRLNKSNNEALERLKTLINGVIADKRARIAANNGSSSKNKWEMDFLDRILEESDEDGKTILSDQEIFDEVMGFFFAGHETSANTITMALMELAQSPDLQDRLRSEVESVLGSRDPTWEDLQSLQFTDFVIKETLRLHPVVRILPRAVNKDEINVLGHRLKKGTAVVANIAVLHRRSDLWESAEEFVPDRWAPENKDSIPPHAYLPFGEGQHQCIGMKMASLEIKIFLAQFLRNYKVTLVPNQNFQVVTTITSGLKNGLLLKVEKVPRE